MFGLHTEWAHLEKFPFLDSNIELGAIVNYGADCRYADKKNEKDRLPIYSRESKFKWGAGM